MIISSFLAAKSALILSWLLILCVGERVHPASLSKGDGGHHPWRRLGRNLGLALLTVICAPLFVVPLTTWAAGAQFAWRPQGWVGAPAFIVDFILLDFFLYWWHRANHRIPFLWRFHVVHHLDRQLDATSALRFHFGEVALSALVRAPYVLMLNIPLPTVIVFEGLVSLGTIFHHSNLALPRRLEAILTAFLVTPALHWVHHHARRYDTDSNYATLWSGWDRLFRTRSPNARRLDLEIGVEGMKERGLYDLILTPLKSPRQTARAYPPDTQGSRARSSSADEDV